MIPSNNRLQGLYAITPTYVRGTALITMVEQAIHGGVCLVQYRDKGLGGVNRVEEASALVKLCHRYQIPVIINDDVELVLATGASGIHLGRDDLNPFVARQKLGADAIIGVSCYNNLDLGLQAQTAGANYVAFGSFFQSATKPEATQAELKILRIAKNCLTIPVAAIGGITCANAHLPLQAGADLLAVSGDIFDKIDITKSALCLSQIATQNFKF
jgi:thiamine-phosphate pyrophosphorylase